MRTVEHRYFPNYVEAQSFLLDWIDTYGGPGNPYAGSGQIARGPGENGWVVCVSRYASCD